MTSERVKYDLKELDLVWSSKSFVANKVKGQESEEKVLKVPEALGDIFVQHANENIPKLMK